MKNKISIVSSCYNEEDNIDELYKQIKTEIDKFEDRLNYEIILLDNASTDGTAKKLRELAQKDFNVKVILNARNFGHIRSPFYGIMQASGDAIIYLASDLQDPPELISQFIQKWIEGEKLVIEIKNKSKESFLMHCIRNLFYDILDKISDDNTVQIKNFTGFGLYDKQIIDIAKSYDDPYPYFRGIISEVGFDKQIINFTQPKRKRGKTKNNFYTLYDSAMLGITKHSKVPLRLMTFGGFVLSIFSMLIAVAYFLYKLIFWKRFALGIAPAVIGLFAFSSVQLFSLGILGEYIGAIYTRIDKKPIVVEKERINF
ncbi:glycosyltransferase family 2 protein [bacterium]|nr:glycosyltransferase family 2 protein [bacterium]